MDRDGENRPFAKPENVTFKRQKQFQASIYNDYTSTFMRRFLLIFSLLFFTKTDRPGILLPLTMLVLS
jgi:hypothetical protein